MFETLFPFLFKVIDRIIPDEQARQAAKMELVKTENQQVLNEMQASLSAIVAEAGSADVWVARARPTFLYVIYVILCACFVGGIIGIWYPEQTMQAATNINALLRAIPQDLYTLFGIGYLGYTGARSFDKWRKIK